MVPENTTMHAKIIYTIEKKELCFKAVKHEIIESLKLIYYFASPVNINLISMIHVTVSFKI